MGSTRLSLRQSDRAALTYGLTDRSCMMGAAALEFAVRIDSSAPWMPAVPSVWP